MEEWNPDLKLISRKHVKVLYDLYFNYMKTVEDGTFEEFRDTVLLSTKYFMEEIHNKYADHVENYRKSRFE